MPVKYANINCTVAGEVPLAEREREEEMLIMYSVVGGFLRNLLSHLTTEFRYKGTKPEQMQGRTPSMIESLESTD